MFLGFLLTSYSSYFFAKSEIIYHITHQDLPLASDNIFSEVQRDLLRPKLISSVMSNDTFIQDWLLSGEEDLSLIKRYLKRIKDEYGAFTTFLVSEKTRNYYHSEGILKKVSAVTNRDNWYFRVRNMPRQSELNLDPDLANQDAWTVFINYKVLDDDGNFLGATGIGLRLERLQEILNSYRDKYHNEVFFIDSVGEILITGSTTTDIKGNIRDLEGISDVASNVLLTVHQTVGPKTVTHNFEMKGRPFILNTRYIEELDLVLAVLGDVNHKSHSVKKAPWMNFALWLVLTACLMGILLWLIDKHQSTLNQLAWHDALTKLMNRQAFDKEYSQIESALKSNKQHLSLLMIDIDNFKKINDKHGHLSGDKVLIEVASILNDHLRKGDILARWGGEEFCFLLPDTEIEAARKVAERIRKTIELESILGERVTVSIGVAERDEEQSQSEHISEADKNLYQAKNSGKNKVMG